MINGEAPRHVAIAPAGYINLAQAVYRTALHADPTIWDVDASILAWYAGLGTALQLEDLHHPDRTRWLASDARLAFEVRLKSLEQAENRLRLQLRQNQLTAVLQGRDSGKTFAFDPDWWAQPNAPAWFWYGNLSVEDPTMIGSNQKSIDVFWVDVPALRGFEADILVEEAGLSRLLDRDAPKQAPTLKTSAVPTGVNVPTPEQHRRAAIVQAQDLLAAEFGRTGLVSTEQQDNLLLEQRGLSIPRESLRTARKNVYPPNAIRRGAPRKISPSNSPEK